MENKQLLESEAVVISPAQLLTHWQGHRRLTRKLIDIFPEEQLFTYSIGGMRPFAEIVMELIDLAGSGVHGIVTGEWRSMENLSHVTRDIPATRAEILRAWDEVTEQLNTLFPQIPIERFQESINAFNAYEGTVFSTLFYFIDNENHHRGQGYVYLRSLGITPPPFWER